MQIFQMINQLKSNQNPTSMINQMFGNDPMFNRAIQMAQGKSPQELEQVVKNLCQQRGIDYGQLMQNFNQMGMKK